ncbi:MAG TPA: RNA-binding protein [candidate division Zixibacteria bacterium]|nr:RNA-binding protein [candidate division Zixibacteria bacterium]
MKIYVGNLSFNSSEDQVRQIFENFGEVVNVNLITDRETGRPRGFGFVEMANDDEARAAIDGMNGKELDGRTLTVNEARQREERGGRPGRRDFNGGNRSRSW